MILFFGSSTTAGENSEVKFTDFLETKQVVKNLGIPGTTLGEYSIYPVDGNSLLSLIKKHEGLIKTCDEIVLEYGINDVTAIMCGFTTTRSVMVTFVKALDAIRQLNPTVDIKFLTISFDPDTIYEYSVKMCKYLSDIYFKGYDIDIYSPRWGRVYWDLFEQIFKKNLDCREMFKDKNEYLENLSSDNLHVNEVGHKIIAKNIGIL